MYFSACLSAISCAAVLLLSLSVSCLYTKPSRFWKTIARNACYQLITSAFCLTTKVSPNVRDTYPGYMSGRNIGEKNNKMNKMHNSMIYILSKTFFLVKFIKYVNLHTY